MNVVVEKDFEAIGDLAWNDLVRRSAAATIFQSWDWQRAWWSAFHEAAEARELLLVCVRDSGGALVALAPLMVEGRANRRVIKFIGDGGAERLDMICADATTGARERVLEELSRRSDQWDAVELGLIPEQSPTAALLRDWCQRSALSHRWERRGSNPALSLHTETRATEGYTAVHTSDLHAMVAHLDAFFVQHIHRWSSSETQSQFALRANREFYRLLVEQQIVRGVQGGSACALRFTTLLAAEKQVAYAFSIAGRHQLWCETSSDILEAGNGVDAVLLDALQALARDCGADTLELARLPAGNGVVPARFVVTVHVTKDRPRWEERFTRTALGGRALALTSELRQVAHVAANASSIVRGRKRRAELGASHRDYYDAGSITRQYVRETRLQKPEQVILHELQPLLPHMRVLDVGVGAGRTVPYFGTTSRDYRGFDFAPNMVAACQHLTGDIVDPSRITVGDARHMSEVADGSCDLVLISYNAIDDIGGEEDRFTVLREVRRVAAPGAYFCFSSHNMKSLTAGGTSGLLPRLRRWRRYWLLRAANPGLSALRKEPRAMIHDVGMDYRFPHYYIAPSAQARQLADFGFADVRVFSVNTGSEILDPARWGDLIDSWVYYLCRIPAS